MGKQQLEPDQTFYFDIVHHPRRKEVGSVKQIAVAGEVELILDNEGLEVAFDIGGNAELCFQFIACERGVLLESSIYYNDGDFDARVEVGGEFVTFGTKFNRAIDKLRAIIAEARAK